MANMNAPLIGISTCIDVGAKINPDRTYQFLEISYAEAVAEAGGIPFIVPFLKSATYEEVLSKVDGLILSGGEDLPTNVPGEEPKVPLVLAPEYRINQDHALLTAALHRRIPLFGICYGMQFINNYFGGTLYYDIPHQLPGMCNHKPGDLSVLHPIKIEEGSRLSRIIGEKIIEVNSSHHQAVRDIGAGLVLAAVCDDGIVEAIERRGEQFILGLQWHPEKTADVYRRKLFSAFVDACRTTSPSRL
jgi:putative glutamine amidotransferase